MYEESINLFDIAIVALIICAAAYYLYKKLFKRNSGDCAKGCDSCPSASRSYRKK